MPIYKLNEKVSYFNNVSTFVSGIDSYASGNMFESLATTNPEAFDSAKLEAMLNSKNLVNDFHEYFAAVMSKDMDRYLEFIKEYAEKSTDEFLGTLYMDYNISHYGVIQKDIEYLRSVLPDNQVMLVLFNTYVPDSLTEDGIKRLIRVRLANNQILMGALMKMLEANHDSFNISLCEAQDLVKSLNDKAKQKDAIGDIRNMIKDPNVLNNFRDDRGNYDFRPIGGAYLIIRNKLELQGAAPAKYLQNLFKYDCIVYSHGNVYHDERSGPIVSTLTPNGSIIYNLNAIMQMIKKDKEFNSIASKELIAKVNKACNKIYKMNRQLFVSLAELNTVYDILRDLWNDMIEFTNTLDIANTEAQEIMYSWIRGIDYYLQPIYDKNNKMQNFKDGWSGRWTIQPVNTLTQKNITHVIDLLRVLKKEGFKNVMIMACNPGSVRLPKDICKDKNFNVIMGMHSVLIENIIDEMNKTDYLNENLLNNLKQLFRNAVKYINNAAEKCHNRFRSISKYISSELSKRFKTSKFKSTTVSTIKIDGSKSVFVETKCSNPAQLEKAIMESNTSIMRMIDELSATERNYMSMVTAKYNVDRSIFESIEFI